MDKQRVLSLYDQELGVDQLNMLVDWLNDERGKPFWQALGSIRTRCQNAAMRQSLTKGDFDLQAILREIEIAKVNVLDEITSVKPMLQEVVLEASKSHI